MFELGHDPNLPLEAGQARRVGYPLGGEQLERHHLVEQAMAGPEDQAHVAADLLKDLVVLNDVARHWIGPAHWRALSPFIFRGRKGNLLTSAGLFSGLQAAEPSNGRDSAYRLRIAVLRSRSLASPLPGPG